MYFLCVYVYFIIWLNTDNTEYSTEKNIAAVIQSCHIIRTPRWNKFLLDLADQSNGHLWTICMIFQEYLLIVTDT